MAMVGKSKAGLKARLALYLRSGQGCIWGLDPARGVSRVRLGAYQGIVLPFYAAIGIQSYNAAVLCA